MKQTRNVLIAGILIFTSCLSWAEPTPEDFHFVFQTTRGDIEFLCPKDWAPIGATRIRELIGIHFFKDVAFFRVINNFVAQFGISGDPATAAKWNDANIKDDPRVASNLAGTLTYATTGQPNSRSTQLFINLVDNTRLDALGFTPVCRISNTTGLAVAKSLYAGYDEASDDQDKISALGNSYLEKNFPKLDYIRDALVVP